jgi:hypothetical protein
MSIISETIKANSSLMAPKNAYAASLQKKGANKVL